MGTCITALLDTWFSLGLDKFHYFVNAPQQKADTINAFGSSYSINQNFGDMNPAYSALLGYRTKQLNYNLAINSTGSTIQAANNSFNTSNAVQTSGAATGMVYWSSNASARYMDIVVSVNRTGRYQLIAKGSDNTNVGNVDVYIDFAATKVGTFTLPNNGNASQTTTSPGVQTSPAVQIPLLTHGAHVFRLRMEAGVGGVAGIKEFTLQPY
jgi:hypothetical protein